MRIDIPEDISKPLSIPKHEEDVTPSEPPPEVSLPSSGSAYETKYDELFHNLYDAAIITDFKGNVLESNLRATQFFEYSSEELQHTNILSIITNADPELLTFVRATLEEQRYVLIQAFCIRKDRTTFPVEISVNLLRIPEAQLCFFIRDITERHKAENALRESELKFRTIFENSTDGISICEYTFGSMPESRLLDCNKAYMELSGHPRHMLFAANIWDLVHLHDPANHAEIMEYIDAMKPYNGTLSWIRPDGQENYLDFRAVPLRIGNRVYVYSIDRDITEQKRAQQAIRKAEKQEAMLASVGAACHHLGQPATVLLTNLTMLQDGVDDPEMIASSLEAAERIADILHKLNSVDEYKTVPYAQGENGHSNAIILDI